MSISELQVQHAEELPDRKQMVTVTLLGLPLVGVAGVDVNLDSSGPGWLIQGNP
ncbi:MAG: hypothetical protein WD602_09080 [Actinomycetota bacterium]